MACTALLACTTWAGPADDARAVLQGWSAAYSANDVESLEGLQDGKPVGAPLVKAP